MLHQITSVSFSIARYPFRVPAARHALPLVFRVPVKIWFAQGQEG